MKKLILVLLVLVVGLEGCAWPPLGMYAPQTNATVLDTLILELWSSHRSLNVNQSITMRLTVKNAGKETVVYDRKAKPVMDISVGNVDNPAMRWSDGKPLTPEITRLELKPGESKVIEMAWKPGAEYDQKGARISGQVWWCAEDRPCYNEVGLPLTIGFVFSPLP